MITLRRPVRFEEGYRLRRARDGVLAAELVHTVVVPNLDAMTSRPTPDVRALEAHLERGG